MAKQEGKFTQIPNIILDDPSLDAYEFRILMHIARQTIGYSKKSDGISLSQFVNATGMSSTKVKNTIKSLVDKKKVESTQQTLANGGKSYNRYSLTLGREVTDLRRVATNPKACGDQDLGRDTPIQNTIEQKTIDKRREREKPLNNILFSLPENIREKEINEFAESLNGIRNIAAYKVKLKQRIDKEDKQTLGEFESWYLSDKCNKLSIKYAGCKVGDYQVKLIKSYLEINAKNGGYGDSDWKFVVLVHIKDSAELRAYSTMKDVELDMQDGFNLGEVIGRAKIMREGVVETS